MVPINSTFIVKIQNYLHQGPPRLQNAINKISQWRSSSFKKNIISKISLIKEKFMKADYPLHFINSVVKGATKLYLTHYLCMVIILFNTGL